MYMCMDMAVPTDLYVLPIHLLELAAQDRILTAHGDHLSSAGALAAEGRAVRVRSLSRRHLRVK